MLGTPLKTFKMWQMDHVDPAVRAPGVRKKRPILVNTYCFNRKNKFPVGGVMVTLLVPLLVLMVPP